MLKNKLVLSLNLKACFNQSTYLCHRDFHKEFFVTIQIKNKFKYQSSNKYSCEFLKKEKNCDAKAEKLRQTK